MQSPVMQTILTRRSIRKYEDRPVPRELIERVLTAAAWAISSHNRQPWRFAVVEEVVKIERLARAMGDRLRRDLEADGVAEELIVKDTGRSYTRITGAPVVIAVCLTVAEMDIYPDDARAHLEFLTAVQSTAMAGQNLLLAAHDAGLGTCWMCAPLFCPDTVRAALNLPEDWQPQGLITMGYPGEVREKTRKPLEEIIIWR